MCLRSLLGKDLTYTVGKLYANGIVFYHERFNYGACGSIEIAVFEGFYYVLIIKTARGYPNPTAESVASLIIGKDAVSIIRGGAKNGLACAPKIVQNVLIVKAESSITAVIINLHRKKPVVV